jgi:amino acid transporter
MRTTPNHPVHVIGMIHTHSSTQLITPKTKSSRRRKLSRVPLGPFSVFGGSSRISPLHSHLHLLTIAPLLLYRTTFTSVMFSYIGMDIVAATAAESRALADVESMKMAARKVNLRVITLYSLAMLTASFVVPMDHPFINGEATSVSARSIFIIAVVEAGMPNVAHFFNAVFCFSAFTCAINSMYIATRVLHTLALRGQTGPEFITKRLRACRSGVPVRAVLVTGALMMVAYMGRSGAPGARLDELANNSTVSCLVVYATICATYLYFFRT